MYYFIRVWAICLALFLTACGGGGGNAGAVISGSGDGSAGGSSGTSSSGVITLGILDPANTQASSVATGGGYTARATLTDLSGVPIANRLVTFSLSGASVATLTPDTALTNSSGVASVAIAPSSLSAIGAATLVATAVVGTATLTVQKDFAVSAANLSLSPIGVGTTNLPAAGNTSVSITALVNGTASTASPVNVTFSTTCGRFNGGTNSISSVTNGSGVASVVYAAVNSDGSLCSGLVTLTASSAGAVSRNVSLNVTAPTANAITFISATPPQIFVAGSGALEQSVVKFKVLSGSTPMINEPVTFSIVTNPGGVGLNAASSVGNVTATTDSLGEASVSVFSGTIPGPVKVRATLNSNQTVFAETQNLSVSSGPASQRFMSLSVETFNIEGWAVDGIGTALTVRLADRQGNPVEDGTVVNFTAEGGQVASSCATVRSAGISSCSVQFISQNPRPFGGRASVLAFVAGTKDYNDVNGNNRYDPGVDTLFDIGDAYRDDNEDTIFNSGEFLIPRGGSFACGGSGAPFPARADTCDASLATTVRQQAVILFSSSSPQVAIGTVSAGGFSFRLSSRDNPLLPMPSGTTVAAEAIDATNNTLSCTVDKTLGTTVPNIGPGTNPSADLATDHSVFLKDCASGDAVLVTIRAPSGLATTFAIPVP